MSWCVSVCVSASACVSLLTTKREQERESKRKKRTLVCKMNRLRLQMTHFTKTQNPHFSKLFWMKGGKIPPSLAFPFLP